MNKIRLHKSEPEISTTNGPGERVVMFFQGCGIHCPGCQNKKLWPAHGGTVLSARYVTAMIIAWDEIYNEGRKQVTISGGEPFDQIDGLAELVTDLKAEGFHIIVYSGFRWERLTDISNFRWLKIMQILEHINILVDGPFIDRDDHPLINWRGSANQRPIDVQATINGKPLGQTCEPVVLNWDAGPIVTIAPDGTMTMPMGVDYDDPAQETARCGEADPSYKINEQVMSETEWKRLHLNNWETGKGK